MRVWWRKRRPARPDDAVEPRSLLGNYLAGRFARAQQDTESAAAFYGDALDQRSGNEVLLEQAFQMETLAGNWPRALPLAEKLAAIAAVASHVAVSAGRGGLQNRRLTQKPTNISKPRPKIRSAN